MTFHLFSNKYPYEHEYYGHPTIYRPQNPYGRRRQMQLLEEQRRKRALEERMIAKEIARRRQMEYEYKLRKRMEEDERRRKLKQMILEQQRKEREQRNKRRVIVQGPDGNYYAMFIENNENLGEKMKSNSVGLKSKHRMRDNETLKSYERKTVPIQDIKKEVEVEVESRNGKMKLGDVVYVKKHTQSRPKVPGSIEIEDASDDESENSSDYSHLVPEEGESWMEPIVN